MNIEDWGNSQFPWGGDFAPGQESIRSVEIETTTLIGLDYRLRIIAEKLIEVVQIAIGSRTNGGGGQGAVVNAITTPDLKIFLKVATAVGECEISRWSVSDGIQKELVHGIALLVCNADEKVTGNLTIDFEVPDFTARIAHAIRNDVRVFGRTEDFTQRVEHTHFA